MASIRENLQAALDERANLFEAEAKPLIDLTDERELTGDEIAKSKEVDRALSRLDFKIRSLQGQLEVETAREALAAQEDRVGGAAAGFSDEIRSVLVAREKAWADFRFTNDDVHRALSTSPAAAGGATIPSTFWNELIQPLQDFSSLLQAGARTVVTQSGEKITIPRVKSYGAAASNITPGATIGGTDPQFENVDWETAKYGQVILAARELIEDSAVDIESFIASTIGQNISLAFGAASISTVTTAVTAGVEGTAATGIPTVDELIDLQHKVIAGYRAAGAFLASDGAVAALRKAKDNNQQYLWQPSVQIGVPDVLLGKPIYTDPFLAAPAAGKKSVLFGDFSRVWVRLVNSLRFERSDQAAFTSDQIAYKGTLRAGTVVTDANALVAFTGKAGS